MADDKDAVTLTTDLGKALDMLSGSADGAGRSFASFSKASNKGWTVISRLLSGTGLWRLQNRIRAMGNAMELYYSGQDDFIRQQLVAAEANIAFHKTFKELQATVGDITKSPFYEVIRDDFEQMGHTVEEAEKLAKKKAGGMQSYVISRFEQLRDKRIEGLKKSLIPSIGERYEKHINKPRAYFGDDRNITKMGFLKKELKKPFLGKSRTISGRVKELKDKLKDKTKGWSKKLGKFNFKALSKFAVIGAAVLGKAAIYFMLIVLGITIIAAFLKRMYPVFKDNAETFKKDFRDIKNQLIILAHGVWNLLKAIFAGDILGVIKIAVMEIMIPVGKILFNVLSLLIKTLWITGIALLVGVIQSLADGIGWLGKAIIGGNKRVYNAAYTMSGLASGGVSSGGMTLVGEQGPELVRLPNGARVFSHGTSNNMRSGHTINVNVTGRVGASDAEIRDIANKVAREINTRINRTTHSTTGFTG